MNGILEIKSYTKWVYKLAKCLLKSAPLVQKRILRGGSEEFSSTWTSSQIHQTQKEKDLLQEGKQ